jgi:hypothetical protein
VKLQEINQVITYIFNPMKTLKKLLFICILVLAPALMTLADPPGPPPPGNNPPGGTPVGAPIDGGISILLALGLGYGVRKTFQLKKKK